MTSLVLLSGGGTVGHLAPGFALRHALARRGVSALFATPGEPREKAWFPGDDPAPIHVPAPRLPRAAAAAPDFAVRLGVAVARAHAVLRRYHPSAVVALGGWPCAPLALAALSARVPLALLAADAVPGLVVRRLARFAGRTYVATDEAREALPGAKKVVVVGRAVRPEILEGQRDPHRFGLADGRATLFVMGGSLGATAVNAAVRKGLRAAVDRRPDVAARVQVIHSTGPAEAEREEAEADYRALAIPSFVTPFLEDVGNAFATADLVLSRAGASTVAEVEATGRPAVFVPYPYHEDRQQYRNAAPLVERGSAAVVEESALAPDVFAHEVLGRLLAPASLARMADAARPFAGVRGDGPAAAIADDLVRWMEEAASRRRPGSASLNRRVSARPPQALSSSAV